MFRCYSYTVIRERINNCNFSKRTLASAVMNLRVP